MASTARLLLSFRRTSRVDPSRVNHTAKSLERIKFPNLRFKSQPINQSVNLHEVALEQHFLDGEPHRRIYNMQTTHWGIYRNMLLTELSS